MRQQINMRRTIDPQKPGLQAKGGQSKIEGHTTSQMGRPCRDTKDEKVQFVTERHGEGTDTSEREKS